MTVLGIIMLNFSFFRALGISQYKKVGLIAVVVGFFLRIQPALRTELWLDEASSYVLSRLSFSELIFQTGGYWDYSHPSLYYALLKAWSSFSLSEIWLRAFSLLWFFPSVLFLYKACLRISSMRAAILCVCIFSVHPLFVDLGFQARMYAATIAFSLISLYGFFEFKIRSMRKAWCIAVVALTIALYLDYSAIWMVVGLFSLSAYYCLIFYGQMYKLMLIPLVALVLYVPQLFVLFLHTDSVKTTLQSGSYFSVHALGAVVLKLLGLGLVLSDYVWLVLSVILFVSVMLFLKMERLLRGQLIPYVVAIYLIFVGVSVVSATWAPVLLDRHLFAPAIFLLVMIGCLLAEGWKKSGGLKIVFLVVYISTLAFTSATMRGFHYGAGSREIAREILQADQPAIMYIRNVFSNTILYYLKISARSRSVPTFEINTIEDFSAASAFPRGQWFVFYSYPCLHDASCIRLKNEVMNKFCLEVPCVMVKEI